MADVNRADLQLPPPAAVHRQRFYFLRHGQSMNNLYSLQDEADKPLQEAQREHQQQVDEEQQQQRRRRCSPCSQDRCTRQLDQCQSQRDLSAHTTEQHQHQRKQGAEETHQVKQRQHLYRGALRRQRLLDRQKGPFSQFEDEMRPTGVPVEQKRAGSPRRRTADPSLTEVGRQQAAAAAVWVQRHVQETLLRSRAGSKRCGQIAHRAGKGPSPAIKKIVCSPMRRAVETAAELRKVITVDVYVHPLLFEQGGLFSGPRKIAAPTAPTSGGDAACVALDKTRSSRCVGEAWERPREGSSRISSTGFERPEVCESSCMRNRKAAVPTSARRACSYPNSGACEGLTLQEVKSLLPGVKIIHCYGRVSCGQHFCTRANGDGQALAHVTERCSNTSARSSRSVSQSNVKADTGKARGNLDAATSAAATESGLVVQQRNDERAVKEDVVGGHYCEAWTRGGRSWWCGGREKLVDTVLRAAEIVSWMQEECHVAEDTGGSVLMVMHGLMMDLIVKTLLFPFSSVSSASPYLELLEQSLRAHEAASGKPLYNMPQQTAYFISSNCSFCCLELAAAAHEPRSYPSGSSPQSACNFHGITAPTHRKDFKASKKSSVLVDGGCTAGVERGVAQSDLCGRYRQRKGHPQSEQSFAGSMRYFGTEYLGVSARVSKGMCRPAEDVKPGDALVLRDDLHGLAVASVLGLSSPQLAKKKDVAVRAGSGRNAAHTCVPLNSTQRSAVVAAAYEASAAAPSGSTPRASFSSPAPALVSALIEWNVPAVDPELHSGQTLGSSVLMSC